MRGQRQRGGGRSSEGERTCVVCRACRPRAALVRFTWDGGFRLGRGPGRGAWVCAAASCLGRLEVRHLARAWRKAPAAPLSWPALATEVAARKRWSTTLQGRNDTMADQAAYWSALWYEIDSLRSGAQASGPGAWPLGDHGANDDEVA